MSEITLSKAVRSNLLNLQSTAGLLSKSQERLSTGLRVNSALDNPTNFFTAQGLNSRANDLSQLLDSVSNAVQTVAAADKGISAITKLVESAQATARQALQTAATVSTTTAATAGSVTGGSFTTLNISGTGAAAGNASLVGTSAVSINLSSQGAQNASLVGTSAITPIVNDPAENAAVTGSTTWADVDASGGDITFDVNGQQVTLAQAGGNAGVYDLAAVVQAINTQVGVSASVQAADDGNGNLQITSTGTAGASDSVTVDNFSAGDATQLGFAGATATDTGADAESLTFTVNSQTVTLGAGTFTGADIAQAITTQVGVSASVSASYANNALTITSTGTAGASDSVTVAGFSTGDASQLGFAAQASVNDTGAAATDLTFTVNSQTVTLAGGSTYTGAQVAQAITTQVGVSASVSASYANNALTITSTGTAGASDSVTVAGFSSGNASQLGFAAQASVNDLGSAQGTADSVSFSITRDSGSAQTITLDAAAVTSYNTAHGTSLQANSLSAANVASLINEQAGAAVATVSTGGALVLSSTTTGASSNITVGAVTSTATSGSIGFSTSVNDSGSATSSTSTTNAKRAELVETYNDLLEQIDAIAKDSGFNGVNLLNGDNLSVLFNEDGSSKLDITGVTNTASGLGLTALASTGFDTNTSINSTLDDLKDSIDTLRSQSAKFGSNLSVVETRQDFTKNMINVLQTGASNLTLADTNEEAANVLALQTRQQLSSTALSLASQADQNVLRLF